jgi:hypothetical protein
MIIHKSRKKAVCITVAGLLAGIAGGLVLYYVRDVVLGWCFVITAGFALLYGIGSLRPPALYRPDRIRHHRTVRDPRADRVGCRPLRGRLLFPGPVLGPAAARPRLQAAAHKAGLVLAVRPSLRVERRQGGLYPYDGTGGRFDAAGRTDPQDERGGYVREDRSAQGIPFGVTRNSVYCFSRFSGTPNRPPPTCVTLLFNACGLNTQNPANV